MGSRTLLACSKRHPYFFKDQNLEKYLIFKMASQELIDKLKDAATRLRIHSVECTAAAGSGHPTSCSSMAETIACLYFQVMHYDNDKPKDASNDRFILSKGHCAPILYAAHAMSGLFPIEEIQKLRKIDSDLEGHPTPRLNFIDVATGSLGQGLSVACGMAYVGKFIDKASYRTYCLREMENLWKEMFGKPLTLLDTTSWTTFVLLSMLTVLVKVILLHSNMIWHNIRLVWKVLASMLLLWMDMMSEHCSKLLMRLLLPRENLPYSCAKLSREKILDQKLKILWAGMEKLLEINLLMLLSI